MPNEYAIYLRKSRKDYEAEAGGQTDTLQRHRTALFALARKMHLNVTGVYEEVVSGDTIAARPEMQRLLNDVSQRAYVGVLVMEVPRLARGDTIDQGIVAQTFKYSGTKIITPEKTYDPANEFDEEYFEFGLFMSRREYKAINQRQQRGRKASLQEGKYIAGAAPYGYERVKLKGEKGYTLAIVPDKAEVVQNIFRWYTSGLPSSADGAAVPIGAHRISKHLDALGIPSPGGGRWTSYTIRDILKNPTYTGKIRWGYRAPVKSFSDGQLTVRRPANPSAPLIDGRHPAIIDEDTFARAAAILSSRSNAPIPSRHQIQNPLAGLVFCGHCGHAMSRRQFKHGRAMLLCPDKDCHTCAAVLEEVEQALLASMSTWLADYKVQLHNADPGADAADTEQAVFRLRQTVSSIKKQIDNAYDFLEQGVYSVEVFTQRSSALADRLAAAQQELADAEQLQGNLANIQRSRREIIPRMAAAIETYPHLTSVQEKNALLKSVLERVVYHKSTGGRYAKTNDMQLFLFPRTTTLSAD